MGICNIVVVFVCSYRTKSTITRSASRAGSTDSLARNTLLAAQVLRLIPTQEARERLAFVMFSYCLFTCWSALTYLFLQTYFPTSGYSLTLLIKMLKAFFIYVV